MRNQMPKKPATTKEQVSMLWDAVYNHIFTQLKWQDMKINFILALAGLILALLGIVSALALLK